MHEHMSLVLLYLSLSILLPVSTTATSLSPLFPPPTGIIVLYCGTQIMHAYHETQSSGVKLDIQDSLQYALDTTGGLVD